MYGNRSNLSTCRVSRFLPFIFDKGSFSVSFSFITSGVAFRGVSLSLFATILCSVSYYMTIEASIFFHMFFSFFDGHFVNIHRIRISSSVCVPWCKGSLCLICVGIGCSSASSKDFLYSSVLRIILRCLFVPFINSF